MIKLLNFDILKSRFVVVHSISSFSPSSGKILRLLFSFFVNDRVLYNRETFSMTSVTNEITGIFNGSTGTVVGFAFQKDVPQDLMPKPSTFHTHL